MRLIYVVLLVFMSTLLIESYTHNAIASSKSNARSSHKSHSRKKSVARGPTDVWERIRAGLRIPRPGPASPLLEEIAAAKHTTVAGIPDSINTTSTTDVTTGTAKPRISSVIIPKSNKTDASLADKSRTRHVLMPHKADNLNQNADNSLNKYTRLGRQKLGHKESTILLKKNGAINSTESKNTDISLLKSDKLFKSPSMQRVRTRLGLHPELFKQNPEPEIVAAESNKTSITTKTKPQPQAMIKGCADLNRPQIVQLARQGLIPATYAELAAQCVAKQNASYQRVNSRIESYSQQIGHLKQVAERARPYLYHIVDSLNKHGMPMDLALLPIVESAFHATALSNKAAAGIWQFIPSTGKEYGLVQHASYDGRLDVTSATNAAIRFLSGLNGHFKGDWLLSLAAYNSGQGTVDAAIAQNQAAGLDTDFWSLDLPAETEDYVPRLLALSSIFANPASYGLKLRPLKNEPYFIKVILDRSSDIDLLVNRDLKTIAKLANYDPDEFSLLNTAYLNSTILEKKPFNLLMPIGNANLLQQSLAFMSQSNKDLKTPETKALADLNLAIETTKPAYEQAFLVLGSESSTFFKKKPIQFDIKQESTSEEQSRSGIPADNSLMIHYLDKGETLTSLAEYYGISENKLRELNKIKRHQSIGLGHRLFIPFKQLMSETARKTNPSILFKDLK